MKISYRIELPCNVKGNFDELTFVNLLDLTKNVNERLGELRSNNLIVNDELLNSQNFEFNENNVSFNQITSVISPIISKSEACLTCNLGMGGKLGCYNTISIQFSEDTIQYLLNRCIISWEDNITKLWIKQIINKKIESSLLAQVCNLSILKPITNPDIPKFITFIFLTPIYITYVQKHIL